MEKEIFNVNTIYNNYDHIDLKIKNINLKENKIAFMSKNETENPS